MWSTAHIPLPQLLKIVLLFRWQAWRWQAWCWQARRWQARHTESLWLSGFNHTNFGSLPLPWTEKSPFKDSKMIHWKQSQKPAETARIIFSQLFFSTSSHGLRSHWTWQLRSHVTWPWDGVPLLSSPPSQLSQGPRHGLYCHDKFQYCFCCLLSWQLITLIYLLFLKT
jgi:hypothetical protein